MRRSAFGRVAVHPRPLAGHDHLIGGDQRAHGAVGVALGRIEQDEVAPLGKFGVDEPAGGIERAARQLVFPVRRHEGLARRRPQRRRRLVPAGTHADLIELAVEFLQACRRGQDRTVATGTGDGILKRTSSVRIICQIGQRFLRISLDELTTAWRLRA